MRRPHRLLAACVLLGWSATALAQGANEDLVCRPDAPELDLNSTLRAISLDVRGRVPTPEEYAALAGQTDIPEALLDEWLNSEDFITRAVRWHRELLWNNITNLTVTSFRMGLTRTAEGLWYRRSQGLPYRGLENISCQDVPAQFDGDGNIVTVLDAGAQREGYVMVEPYWAPGTQIKVCAFDAQANLVTDTGEACGRGSIGKSSPQCGCGPNMRWCRQGDINTQITRAMAEDVERRIAALIREDRPYTELFTTRRAFVNGPLVHFFRHQAGLSDGISFEPVAVNVEQLPNIPFTEQTTWAEIELPAGHAGILTSPAYLLRFQTQRARTNRFFNAFLCEPFQPPVGGIPVGDVAAMREPDLQKRHGCKYCHALLEPAGAHWGRWPERSAGYLEPTRFPALRDDCRRCGQSGGTNCPAECSAFYFTRATYDSEKPYLGMLWAYHFLRDDHLTNVDQGPSYLMRTTVADNRLPACVSGHTLSKLAGRLLLPEEETVVNDEMAAAFVQSNYNFKTLVKRVVTSPVYRRVR